MSRIVAERERAASAAVPRRAVHASADCRNSIEAALGATRWCHCCNPSMSGSGGAAGERAEPDQTVTEEVNAPYTHHREPSRGEFLALEAALPLLARAALLLPVVELSRSCCLILPFSPLNSRATRPAGTNRQQGFVVRGRDVPCRELAPRCSRGRTHWRHGRLRDSLSSMLRRYVPDRIIVRWLISRCGVVGRRVRPTRRVVEPREGLAVVPTLFSEARYGLYHRVASRAHEVANIRSSSAVELHEQMGPVRNPANQLSVPLKNVASMRAMCHFRRSILLPSWSRRVVSFVKDPIP